VGISAPLERCRDWMSDNNTGNCASRLCSTTTWQNRHGMRAGGRGGGGAFLRPWGSATLWFGSVEV
jgi:hypothetical protein